MANSGSRRSGSWQHHHKTTTERGYGWQWQKLREQILSRDQHLCLTCKAKGRVTPATQVDHIKPKSRGGTDDPDNLASICSDCHEEKSQREAAEAQGRTYKRKRRVGLDGYPVDG